MIHAIALMAVIGAPSHVVGCDSGDTCTFAINLGLGVWKTEQVKICDISAPTAGVGQAKKMIMMLLRSAKEIDVRPYGGIRTPHRINSKLLAWINVDGRDVGQMLVDGGLVAEIEKKCK